jgi:hypothetical protein
LPSEPGLAFVLGRPGGTVLAELGPLDRSATDLMEAVLGARSDAGNRSPRTDTPDALNASNVEMIRVKVIGSVRFKADR